MKPGLSTWVWQFRWGGPGDNFFFVWLVVFFVQCVFCLLWMGNPSLLQHKPAHYATILHHYATFCMYLSYRGEGDLVRVMVILLFPKHYTCKQNACWWGIWWGIWAADSETRPCVSCVSSQGCHQPRVRARWSFTCWTTTTTPPTWSRQWHECVKTHMIWMWP